MSRKKIKTGQIFMCKNYPLDGPYILAQVAANECSLISLLDGNRWNTTIAVYNNKDITLAEWNKICSTAKFVFLR
jgi:hypothetical protein